MHPLVEAGLSNAVAAAVLAVAVLLVTRFWRNVHAAHALWLLVLAKLVTPPLWQVPVPWSADADRASGTAFSADGVADEPAPVPQRDDGPAVVDGAPMAGNLALPPAADPGETIVRPSGAEPAPAGELAIVANEEVNLPAAVAPAPEAAAAADEALPAAAAPTWSLSSLLLTLWLGVAALVAGIAALRVVRFQRLLSATEPAPAALVRQVAQLAARMGLRRPPAVRLVQAAVGPLVWPLWRRPVVLLPARLVEQLSRDQLATILAHELAHLKRRDHLVRLLEVVVTAFYWWHPVLLLARHRLRAAEEACCDAWVLQLFPERCRQYGEALLRAAEFGSARAAPLLASGIGRENPHSLKRRIEMILSNRVPAGMARWAKFVLLAAAVAVLPLSAVAAPDERPRNGRGDDSGPDQPQQQLEVHEVNGADSETVLQVLQTLFAGAPRLRLSRDPVTGNIIALGAPEDQATIRRVIEQMVNKARRKGHGVDLPAVAVQQTRPAEPDDASNLPPKSTLSPLLVPDESPATSNQRRGDTEKRLAAIEQQLKELFEKMTEMEKRLGIAQQVGRSSRDSTRAEELLGMRIAQVGKAADRRNAQIKVFTLQYADAGELAGLLQELLADGTTRIVADPRTNMLIIRGDADGAIEALIEKLDVPPRRRPQRGAPEDGSSALPPLVPLKVARPRVEGIVLNVGEDATVEVSLGAVDGLAKDMTLLVHRVSEAQEITQVAQIRVLRVEKDRAVARVVQQQEKIEKGDRVSPQRTGGRTP